MRRLIFSALTALALSSGAAVAADMPVKAYAAPAFNWTGFYIGANGGYGWCANCTTNVRGGFAGGQLGYNWQFNQFVLGVEGDLDGSWIKSTTIVGAATVDLKNNSFATIRARAGFAVDRALLYATGGWAWSSNSATVTIGGVGVSSSNNQNGYAAGGGLEYALDRNWTVKGEYLYIGLQSGNFFGVPTGNLNLHTVKVGVNYLFH